MPIRTPAASRRKRSRIAAARAINPTAMISSCSVSSSRSLFTTYCDLPLTTTNSPSVLCSNPWSLTRTIRALSLMRALMLISPQPNTRMVFSAHFAGRLANTRRRSSISRSAKLGCVASRSSRDCTKSSSSLASRSSLGSVVSATASFSSVSSQRCSNGSRSLSSTCFISSSAWYSRVHVSTRLVAPDAPVQPHADQDKAIDDRERQREEVVVALRDELAHLVDKEAGPIPPSTADVHSA